MRILLLVAAVALANIVGVIAVLAAGKLALLLDPAANESHITSFIVAIIGVAAAVASAFPIFARGVPWAAPHLERLWPPKTSGARQDPVL